VAESLAARFDAPYGFHRAAVICRFGGAKGNFQATFETGCSPGGNGELVWLLVAWTT
jgi:hypothetical protein